MKEKKSMKRLEKASIKLFSEKGYEATTIRDICQDVEITAPSLYYYFESKESLYLHVVEQCEKAHREAVEEAMETCNQETAEKRLGHLFEALVAFHQKEQDLYEFWLRSFLFPPASLKHKLEEMTVSWREEYQKMLIDFLNSSAEDSLPSIEISDVLEAFQKLVLGHILSISIGRTSPSKEKTEQTWNQFWNGIP